MTPDITERRDCLLDLIESWRKDWEATPKIDDPIDRHQLALSLARQRPRIIAVIDEFNSDVAWRGLEPIDATLPGENYHEVIL
ncbi:MAG: hypothetical protein HQ582_15825 [Planctomycetes bacterium]|nr:hypothetical protein [Planctomycetota bacterium]